MQEKSSKIITDTSNPVITMPKRVFPTINNYGTCRFNRGEVIICKDVAFQIQLVTAKKISLKLLDKSFADELIKGNTP